MLSAMRAGGIRAHILIARRALGTHHAGLIGAETGAVLTVRVEHPGARLRHLRVTLDRGNGAPVLALHSGRGGATGQTCKDGKRHDAS
jgi:hypothetical protein